MSFDIILNSCGLIARNIKVRIKIIVLCECIYRLNEITDYFFYYYESVLQLTMYHIITSYISSIISRRISLEGQVDTLICPHTKQYYEQQ